MVERVLQRAILRHQLERRFRTHAGNARNVVGGIAGKPEDVAHLIDARNAPLCQHFRDAERFRPVAHARGPVLEHMLGHELPEILVRRHHVGREAFLLRLAGQRADKVVGLVAVQLQHRQVERADQFLDVGQCLAELLRHGVALRLVGRELGMPRGGCFGVEHDRQVRRREAAHQVEQRVGEAVDGRRVPPGSGADGIGRQREVRAVGQRHAVEKKKGVFAVAHDERWGSIRVRTPNGCLSE